MMTGSDKYTTRLTDLQEEFASETQRYLRQVAEIKANRDPSSAGQQKQLDAAQKAYETEITRIEGRIQSVTDSWRKAMNATKPKREVSTEAVERLRSKVESIGPASNVLSTTLDLLMRDKSAAVALTSQDGTDELRKALQKAGAERTETAQLLTLVETAASKRVEQHDPNRYDRGRDEVLLMQHGTALTHAIKGVKDGLSRGGQVMIARVGSDEKPETFDFSPHGQGGQA